MLIFLSGYENGNCTFVKKEESSDRSPVERDIFFQAHELSDV